MIWVPWRENYDDDDDDDLSSIFIEKLFYRVMVSPSHRIILQT